jgi:solute carrier family 6 amino acid transporter-like protein 5/7/9/14
MLLTYCLFFFAMCFQKELPWTSCSHSYNTEFCFDPIAGTPCKASGGAWYNQTCYYQSNFTEYDAPCNFTEYTMVNETSCVNGTYNPMWEDMRNLTKKLVQSSEEYFYLGVLEKSNNIDDTNGIKWELVLCLLAMWIICFFTLIKGIESSGKVVYFTTTFPYIVLTILLVRGVMLNGSLVGIKYLLTPDWTRLMDAKVWGDAAGQIFFSLSVGAGGLMTYSSYNKFHSNIYRDALIVSIANSATDWYSGFVVFSALGYMATSQNVEVKDVAADGAGLAFVVYPQVTATLPVPQLWSALFYFMLILLGLDSLNASIEAIITATVDKWTGLRPVKYLVTGSWCIFFFLLGFPMCCRSGFYWLDLVSYYSSGWTLVVMGIMEAVVFSWIYGAKKVIAHVKEMAGVKLYFHWWIIWSIISPLLLIAVLIFNLVLFKPLMWNNEYPPAWVPVLGWLMTLAPLGIILIFAIIKVILLRWDPNPKNLTFGRRFINLFKPDDDWCSALEAKERRKAAKAAELQHNTAIDEVSTNGFTNLALTCNDDGDRYSKYANMPPPYPSVGGAINLGATFDDDSVPNSHSVKETKFDEHDVSNENETKSDDNTTKNNENETNENENETVNKETKVDGTDVNGTVHSDHSSGHWEWGSAGNHSSSNDIEPIN